MGHGDYSIAVNRVNSSTLETAEKEVMLRMSSKYRKEYRNGAHNLLEKAKNDLGIHSMYLITGESAIAYRELKIRELSILIPILKQKLKELNSSFNKLDPDNGEK